MTEILYFKNKIKMKTKINNIKNILDTCLDIEGENFVIALSGEILTNISSLEALADDIKILKKFGIHIVITFNPIEKIFEDAKRLNLTLDLTENNEPKNSKTSEIFEMIINNYSSYICSVLNKKNIDSISMTGKDMMCIEAIKHKNNATKYLNVESISNISYQGDIVNIKQELFTLIEEHDITPVISSIASGKHGETVHIPYEQFSASVAAALCVSKLIYICDETGIIDQHQKVIKEINIGILETRIEANEIHNASVFNKKITTGATLLKNDISEIIILSGKIDNQLLLQLFSEDTCGTVIKK
jgi:acetylglutamate kinase